MNYLKLVRNLNAVHKKQRFTGNEYLTYSCLIELFNDAGTSQDWPDSLFIQDDTLFNLVGISLNKMKECRDELRKRGLIDFKEPGRGVRTGTEYWLDPSKRMSEKSSESSSDSDILLDEKEKGRQKECQKECQNLTNSYIYSIPNYPNHQTIKQILSVAHRDDASVWQVIVLNLAFKKKAKPKKPPQVPQMFKRNKGVHSELLAIFELWNSENVKYTASIRIGVTREGGLSVAYATVPSANVIGLPEMLSDLPLNMVRGLLLNICRQQANGHTSMPMQLEQSGVVATTQQFQRIHLGMFSIESIDSMRLLVNHSEILAGNVRIVDSEATSQLSSTLTASFPESRAGLTLLEICAYCAQTVTNAEHTASQAGKPNGGRATPLPPNIPFIDWYNAYDKKRDPKDCEAEWIKLTDEQRQTALAHTIQYVAVTPKEYRKDPIRYLKKQSWNDEIIQRHEQRSAYSGSGNQRQRNGNRQSLAETGSEIDRLAEEYFGPQY